MRLTLRAVLGSLQLPIAGFGLFLTVTSVGQLLTMPSPPPGSDGFPQGLAVIFLFVIGYVGMSITALGFAIPPGDGFGIRFSTYQRYLFGYAVIAAFASVLLPLLVFAAFQPAGSLLSMLTLGALLLGASSPLAIVVALGWKLVSVLSKRIA